MKIYVIRHGLTELNKKNLINGHLEDGLAPEGMEQAKTAAPFLPKTLRHIYSSSLLRAKQTAEILNSERKLPITFHPGLAEVNFGNLNGQAFTDERKKLHMSQKYDWRRENGESVEDVRKRLLKVLHEIHEKSKNEEALLVTHGGIIRLLTLLETGNVLDEIQNVSLHSFDLDKILERNK